MAVLKSITGRKLEGLREHLLENELKPDVNLLRMILQTSYLIRWIYYFIHLDYGDMVEKDFIEYIDSISYQKAMKSILNCDISKNFKDTLHDFFAEMENMHERIENFREKKAVYDKYDHVENEIYQNKILKKAWQEFEPFIKLYQRKIRNALREVVFTTDENRRELYLEGMLREAIISHAGFNFGPILHPLILRSYNQYKLFCMHHHIDQGQLHRFLHGHTSISMNRLISILEDFFPSYMVEEKKHQEPIYYELKIFPKAVIDQKLMGQNNPFNIWSEEATILVDSNLFRNLENVIDPGINLNNQTEDGFSLKDFCYQKHKELIMKKNIDSPLLKDFGRSYTLRVLRRELPGSYHFFSKLVFPHYLIIIRQIQFSKVPDQSAEENLRDKVDEERKNSITKRKSTNILGEVK